MRYAALLLADHPGPRRICPARAGRGRRRLCRRRAQRQRHGCDDEDDGGGEGHAAVCAAVPEGRQARDRPDRQHPALSRRRAMGWRRRRKRANCGCTSCSSRSPISCSRFTTPIIRSGPRSITRTRARRRRSAPRNSGRSACRNISAISRSCWRPMAGAYVTGRRLTYVDLSLFQIVEGLRYAFPKRMKAFEREIPRPGRSARPRRGAAEHQGVSGERAADCVQRGGDFPAVQGAGWGRSPSFRDGRWRDPDPRIRDGECGFRVHAGA